VIKPVKYQRACAVSAAALFALAAAACGDSDSGSSGYGDDDDSTSAAESPSETATAETAASLATAQDDELGEFLVDNDGLALYLFTTDTGDTSTCYDACATSWPPLLTDTADVAASGSVDATLIGTSERTDGTTQVTYGGHPLYYYMDDDEPGETEGQGVNNVWFVVNPDGSANTKDD